MKHIDSKDTVTWKQVQLAETCHSEQAWRAKDMIKNYLGYTPARTTCVPELPFIQTLAYGYKKGQIDYDSYYTELEFHIRIIRNRDFHKTWWIMKHPFCKYDYDMYNKELYQSKDRAHAELAGLLTFEPELDYSLHSEMMLRRLYQADVVETDTEHIETCLLAASAVLYREVLIKEGPEAADASSLYGQRLYREMNLSPITGKPLE